MDSALQITALESKSAALCQYERTLVPMQAVTCDCTNSGSSQCFAEDPSSSIAQTQVCSDSGSVQYYSGLRLEFYNETVNLGCSDVLISKISIRNYQAATEEKLLANFIPLTEKDIPKYPVYNDKDALVGRILTDGITLSPLAGTTLGEFQLCIQLEAVQKEFDTSDEYPILDMATTDAHDNIIPLGMDAQVTKIFENSVYDGYYLCARINLTTDSSYFAIGKLVNGKH